MDSIIVNAPWFSHALAGTVMVLGLLMWLFGGRALKVAFAAFGAGAGALLALTLPPEIASGPVRVLAIVGGGLIGALVGAAAFRFAVAFVLAGVMMLVVPILTIEGIEWFGSPLAHLDEDTPLSESEMLLEGVPFHAEGIDLAAIGEQNLEALEMQRNAEGETPETTSVDNRLEVWLARCEDFLWKYSEELKVKWDQQPARDKSLLVLSCLGGLVLGLAIGLGAPKFAAVLLAAGAGGILFLPSAVWLLKASKAETGWLPTSAAAWVLVWIGLSAIGGLMQRFLIRKRKKKAAADAE